MHSRVFCFAKNLDEIRDIYDSISEEDIVEEIRGVDYAVVTDEFEGDIRWLAEVYEIPEDDIKIETYEVDGEKIKIARIKVRHLLAALKKERERRFEAICKELEKEHPSLFEIARKAYLEKGFYAYIPDWGIEPMFIIPEIVKKYPSYFENNFKEEVYIYKIFDYHF